ncbi:uncharacterized protein TRAVEDRAFT_20458 [Trametes versicolor FP-101664 SS1]|uniref:uncharacterized protein n=1 Tax=Trametes versicolor (strain FP-101664) TaxID=717944 RepID=UPI0004621D00|nr:uncharacterized protein TRAVEDRAFT_20458 [Trametes versicolor FP-101664 SS1]EIW58451.1 hypothetical protein TRAVEDRAFT_20458 [Trametes versicolor FP-101664 SS1]
MARHLPLCVYWPIHRGECEETSTGRYIQEEVPQVIESFSATSSLVEVHRHGVVGYIMEAQHDQCVFKIVECSTAVVDGHLSYTAPHLGRYFAYGRGAHILHYDERNQYLTKPYHIFYCTRSFILNGSGNRAIASLLETTNHELTLLWPGTVVVFKYSSNLCTAYEDMEQADVGNIAAHFARFGQWQRARLM